MNIFYYQLFYYVQYIFPYYGHPVYLCAFQISYKQIRWQIFKSRYETSRESRVSEIILEAAAR